MNEEETVEELNSYEICKLYEKSLGDLVAELISHQDLWTKVKEQNEDKIKFAERVEDLEEANTKLKAELDKLKTLKMV